MGRTKMASRLSTLNANEMLREDHDKVKTLFEQFGEAQEESVKKEIVQQTLLELKVHTALEEEIYYPAIRERLAAQDEEVNELMDESEEEHQVAKALIEELEKMEPGDQHFDAKFKVLADSIRHHILEEETKTLPLAEESGMELEDLGEQMAHRKVELQEEIQNLEAIRPDASARSEKKSKGRTHRGRASRS